MSTLSDSQISKLDTLGQTLSSFSFICSVCLIFCYVFFRNLRSFAFKMVIMISVADALFCIGHMMGDQPANTGSCTFQAVWISYFELVSLFWTVMIGRVLQQLFLNGETDVQQQERKYQIICWGGPALLIIFPSFTSSYGDSGAFCWIKGDKGADTAWRFLVFYLWLWAGIGYICYIYWAIRKQFDQMTELDATSEQVNGGFKWPD
jgi:hypothetical protein